MAQELNYRLRCTPEKAKEIAQRVAANPLNRSDPFTFARVYSNLVNGVHQPQEFE